MVQFAMLKNLISSRQLLTYPMTSDNPYEPPQQTRRQTVPSLLFWSIGAVFMTGLIGGTLGTLIGYALGSLSPGYYRSVFSQGNSPTFEPVSVGIGLGLTQGILLGIVVGLFLVAMFYWHRTRLPKTTETR